MGVQSNANRVNVRPEQATGNYKSSTNMAANTPDTVFTAASNTNGAIVLSASFWSGTAAATIPNVSLLAKATAPTTPVDGEIILSGDKPFTQSIGATLPKEQYIPAGLGLYFITNVAENNGLRACRYKLL